MEHVCFIQSAETGTILVWIRLKLTHLVVPTAKAILVLRVHLSDVWEDALIIIKRCFQDFLACPVNLTSRSDCHTTARCKALCSSLDGEGSLRNHEFQEVSGALEATGLGTGLGS